LFPLSSTAPFTALPEEVIEKLDVIFSGDADWNMGWESCFSLVLRLGYGLPLYPMYISYWRTSCWNGRVSSFRFSLVSIGGENKEGKIDSRLLMSGITEERGELLTLRGFAWGPSALLRINSVEEAQDDRWIRQESNRH